MEFCQGNGMMNGFRPKRFCVGFYMGNWIMETFAGSKSISVDLLGEWSNGKVFGTEVFAAEFRSGIDVMERSLRACKSL